MRQRLAATIGWLPEARDRLALRLLLAALRVVVIALSRDATQADGRLEVCRMPGRGGGLGVSDS